MAPWRLRSDDERQLSLTANKAWVVEMAFCMKSKYKWGAICSILLLPFDAFVYQRYHFWSNTPWSTCFLIANTMGCG